MSDRPKSKFATILAAGAAVVALNTGCATYNNTSNDREGSSRTVVGPNGSSYRTTDRSSGATFGVGVDKNKVTIQGGAKRGQSVGVTLDTKKALEVLTGVLGGGAKPQPGNGGTTPTPLAEPAATGTAPAKKPQPQF